MSTNAECAKVVCGQVSNQVDRQRNQADELEEVVDKLETRLVSVVEPPAPTEQGQEDRPSLVTTADAMFSSNESVAGSIRRLALLLDRIEI